VCGVVGSSGTFIFAGVGGVDSLRVCGSDERVSAVGVVVIELSDTLALGELALGGSKRANGSSSGEAVSAVCSGI
jgi:hypothetical protein